MAEIGICLAQNSAHQARMRETGGQKQATVRYQCCGVVQMIWIRRYFQFLIELIMKESCASAIERKWKFVSPPALDNR